MSKIKIGKTEIIWSYIGMAFTMGINFVILPFLIFYLNEDELGLWYVYLSIGSIVNLFDFGFAPTITRNIAYCWGGAQNLSKEGINYNDASTETNFSLLNKVLKVCRIIYFVIACLALLFLISGGTIYINYVARNMQKSSYFLSWLFYVIAIFFNLFYGYYNSFLYGIGAVAQANKSMVISRIIQVISCIVLLCCGYGLIAPALSYLLYIIFFRFISKRLFLAFKGIGKKLGEVKEKVQLAELKELFNILWYNAWRDGLVSFSKFLISQATTIICSLYYSLAETGIYALSIQIVNAIASISSNIYSTYQPVLQENNINNKKEDSKKLFSLIMCSYALIYVFICLVVLTIGIPLINIIKPTTQLSIPLLIFMCLYMFLNKKNNIYASYISNSNKLPYVKSFIVSGLLTIIVALAFIFFTDIGIWGLVLAQEIPQMFYNDWKWASVVKKDLELTTKKMIYIGMHEIYIKAKIKYFKIRK